MRALALALRTLLREWRSGELGVLVLALVVAVAALTGVGFLVDRIGLAVDNLVQLLLIDTLCRGVLGFPADLVYGRILPGAAMSILVGNLVYAYQAKRLAGGDRERHATHDGPRVPREGDRQAVDLQDLVRHGPGGRCRTRCRRRGSRRSWSQWSRGRGR